LSTTAVIVPGYRIMRPLGIGGMASVYLALQESLDREVALKVMAPALAANEEFTERFLKEGRITAKLSHPNLVTVYDIGSHGSTYYLAAEYIPGGTLRERLGKLSIAEALDVARDIALGLAYAHDKGFVHRDVKPGNILFRANGTAVLADFGIAKSINSKTVATQAGNSIGTPHYMSPEQARAEKVDGRSDLYSLGAVLFEMLTGDAPYLADDPFTIALMHVTQPVPELPPPLAWMQPLVDGLMAKDPTERYATGEEFVAACDAVLASAPEATSIHDGRPSRQKPAARLSTPSRGMPAITTARAKVLAAQAEAARPARDRKPLVLGSIALVAALAAAGAWLKFGNRDDAVSPEAGAERPTTSEATPPIASSDVPDATPPQEATGSEAASDATDFTLPVDGNDVTALLARADEYVKTGFMENGRRLTTPEGDCAVDLYRRVLTLDAGNGAAAAGLQRIAAYYEQKGKAAFDRGVYNGSEILAEEGLKADPASAGLKKLLEDSRKALTQ
jgi:serine/threonine-protein kinase PpkA